MQSTTTQNGLRSPVLHNNNNTSTITTNFNTTTTTSTNGLNHKNNNNNSNSAADLVLGAQRHHRDLFSGSLGIPDVSTHVGSVVHAFETMAFNRNIIENGEKPYETSSNLSDHKYNTTGSNLSGKNKKNHKKSLKGSYNFNDDHQRNDEIFFNDNDFINDPLNMEDYRKSLFISKEPKIFQQNVDENLNPSKNKKYHQNHDKGTSTLHHNFYFSQPTQNLNQNQPDDNSNYRNEDFLRGSTVSQSFIKNVRTSRNGNLGVTNPGFKRDRCTNSTGRLSSKKSRNDNDFRSSKRKSFQPRTFNRAEI